MSAFTAYHTVVVSFVATAAVCLTWYGEADEGTPAHFVALEVTFDSAEYDASKTPPATANPQVLFARAAGAPVVLADAAIVAALGPLSVVVVRQCQGIAGRVV